jgi:hypothetical protein
VSYPLEGYGAQVEEVARGASHDLQTIEYRSRTASPSSTSRAWRSRSSSTR